MNDDGTTGEPGRSGSSGDWKTGWPRRAHLLQAAAQGRPDLVELVIRAGIDLNEVDSFGETALHDAVRLGKAAQAAVATLLPLVTQRDIRNNKGETAAELATGQGRHDLAHLILSGGQTDTWALQRPRLSDEASYLRFEPLDTSDLPWVIARIKAEGDWCKVSPDCMALRHARLPFYDGGELLAIEDSSRQGRREQFALVQLGRDFRPLNWTNEPIYQANEEWGVRFDEETLPAYVRTFFHLVRGHLSPFQIVQNVAEVPWLPEAKSEWKDIAAMHVHPLKLLELDAEKAVFRATIVFKNALFAASVFVALQRKVFSHEDGDVGLMCSGQTKLLAEEMLREDMPVRIAPPATTWG